VTRCPPSSQFSQNAYDNTENLKKNFFLPPVFLNNSLDTCEAL